MIRVLLFSLIFPWWAFSQDSLKVALVKVSPLQVDQLISIDNFGAAYYVNDNVLYKKSPDKTLNYSNLQLNNLTSVNTFNPLKLVLFYRHFNTVIVLDNRLSEIFKIDFNALPAYRNVSLITTGFDNTLWVFNMNLNQLELFDYKTNKTRFTTIPVISKALDLASNYNSCWLLTEKFLYQYNYFGSLVSKIPNEGFSNLKEFNETILLQRENELFLLKEKERSPIYVQLPDLLIKQFFVTNETLYIYDSQKVYEFKLTSN